MSHATAILLAFIASIIGLTAYLKEPTVLLALAFVPSLLQDLPFGLAAAKIQADMAVAQDDEEKPIGFTQEVKSRK
jgi:hypothetical protein